MKTAKRIFSVMLVIIFSLVIIQASSFLSYADTSFTDGDFKYTMVSEDKLFVSGYLGSDTHIELPEFGRGKLVTGIYTRSFQNSDIESVVIPRSYTVISAFAFNGCSGLSSVMLPSSLESIGIMAFNDCKSLQSIDFSYTNSLSNISYAAFCGCTSLEQVDIPGKVKEIGAYAFSGCSMLKSVTLNDGLQSIGNYAFADCTMLEKIELPKTVVSLGDGCLSGCASINDIFLSESVTSIGSDAFAPMCESGDIDIVCYRGSYAAEYGIENGIDRLVIIDSYIGDANRDGIVSISDVTAIQQYIVEMIDDSELDFSAADVDGDGAVTIYDATYIQRFIARLDDPCYICRSKSACS